MKGYSTIFLVTCALLFLLIQNVEGGVCYDGCCEKVPESECWGYYYKNSIFHYYSCGDGACPGMVSVSIGIPIFSVSGLIIIIVVVCCIRRHRRRQRGIGSGFVARSGNYQSVNEVQYS